MSFRKPGNLVRPKGPGRAPAGSRRAVARDFRSFAFSLFRFFENSAGQVGGDPAEARHPNAAVSGRSATMSYDSSLFLFFGISGWPLRHGRGRHAAARGLGQSVRQYDFSAIRFFGFSHFPGPEQTLQFGLLTTDSVFAHPMRLALD